MSEVVLRKSNLVLLIVANLVGVMLAFVDTRPTWDDTGIMVLAILTASAIFGFAGRSRAWAYALSVGIWIPLWNFLLSGRLDSAITIGVALVGAYCGALTRKAVSLGT